MNPIHNAHLIFKKNETFVVYNKLRRILEMQFTYIQFLLDRRLTLVLQKFLSLSLIKKYKAQARAGLGATACAWEPSPSHHIGGEST